MTDQYGRTRVQYVIKTLLHRYNKSLRMVEVAYEIFYKGDTLMSDSSIFIECCDFTTKDIRLSPTQCTQDKVLVIVKKMHAFFSR